MKKLRKFLAVLLVVCMTFGCMQTGVSAQSNLNENEGFSVTQDLTTQEAVEESYVASAEETTSTIGDSVDPEVEPEVTRVEWLQALTTAYGFTVEEDNYPDNYFSDINSESEYYYAVMLATEFGLIDVEAGDPMEPEAAATREFVAHSMNMCMGIQLEENEDGEITYTFDEAESVTYPTDIQVAIDQSWFALDGLSFLPEEAVTQAEADALIDIAEAEVASRVIDENHEDTYSFAEGVVVLDEALEIELTEDDEYTIYGTPEIATGDRIGFVIDDIPFVKKVVSFEADEEKLVVQTETVELEEAFTEIDIEGSSEADLTEVVATCDDVDMFYVIDGTEDAHYEDGTIVDTLPDEQVNAVRLVKTYEIPSEVKEKFNLAEGVSAYIEAVVYNTSEDHKVDLVGESYIAINATVRFTCNVSMDVLKAIGVEDSIELASVSIGGIGKLKVALELQLEGDISVSLVENLRFGVKYSSNQGFSTISSMHKESFSVVAKIEAKAGVKASIGVDLIVIEGYLYAKVGMQGRIELSIYPDSADVCLQVNAWLYAAVGCDIEVNLIFYSKSWNKEISIFDENNSPVRISFHYDNGTPVNECVKKGCVTTTGKVQTGVKYHTPANSQYGYNGSSWGYDSAGEVYTIFKYNVIEDTNNICITSYNGNVSALTIPSTLDGYTVTQIGNDVFKGRTELASVTIPNTVTSIGSSAFSNCTNLSYVKLSDNIKTIGISALSDCTNLKNLNLPMKLESVGECAFANCDSLIEVNIPKNLVDVYDKYDGAYTPQGAFYACSNLKKVTFEEGITTIADSLFYGCDGLEEIEIPETVTEINQYAFFNAGLKKVVISDSVTKIGISAFEACTLLEELKLSYSLASVGECAFANCDSLIEVNIPKNLVDVYDKYDGAYTPQGAFYACSNLKKVTFEEGITTIADSLFYGCDGLEEIVIPDTVTKINQYAFYNSGLKKVTMSDSVTEILHYAFGECTNLSELKLSNGVKILGKGTFNNCDSLTEVYIPKSLTNYYTSTPGPFNGCSMLKKVTFEEGSIVIDGYLFAGCDGLEEIEIPNTITTLGDNCFYNCINLKKIAVPNSVIILNDYVFANCTSLLEITVPNSVTSMGTYIFSNCTSLKTAVLPNSRQNIESGTFYNCTSLKNITLPDALTAICSNAFYNCDALESITIPSGVETIESNAFYDSDALTSVDLPEGVKTVGSYAFSNCDALTTVTLPNTLTSLGNYTFKTCELLTDIHFGTGLKTIGTETFMDCASLQKVVLPYSIESVGSNAFKNDTKLTEIYIPQRVTSIDSSAFSYPKKLTIYGVEGSYADTFAEENGITFVADTTKPTAVTLSAVEVTVNKNKTTQLFATIAPIEYMGDVEWSSADETIATVDKYGIVKGVGGGQTTIICKAGDITATATVNVFVPVSTIYLNSYSATIEAGETYDIQVSSISPSDATNKNIIFESADPTIATVDATGKISGLAIGETTITVKSEDGYASRTFTITVKKPTPKLFISKESVILEPNETLDLMATISPDMVANQAILYSSSDEAVATVDADGKITAVATGTAIITVKTEDGLAEKTCTVTVKDKLILDEAVLTMAVDSAKKLNAVLSEDITGSLVWVSTDKTIVEVAQDGTVTAKAVGKATIIVATSDGKYRAECEIEVKVQPIITLSQEAVTLEEENTFELIATVTPEAYTVEGLVYISSDESVATIDEAGKITAVGEGTATITVKTADGLAEKTCTVTVTKKPEIVLNAETLKLEQGETFDLIASITPEQTESKKLLYASSDENIVVIDENGKVTAVANGTAIIIVKTEDGLLEKTCTVTVASKIVLDQSEVTLKPSDSFKLNITLAEEITGVMWLSTNTSVAEVSQDGTITVKAEGETTIIVTSIDGKYRAECKVTVGEEQPAYTLGDVNADGGIDANDALAVLKAVAKMTTLTEVQNQAANVNKDANVDANDALIILKYVAKMIDSFS